MIEEQNLNNEQQHEESINLYAIFFKYLAYWYLVCGKRHRLPHPRLCVPALSGTGV